MKTKDLTQVALYAASTAIMAVLLLGGRSVNSAGNQQTSPPLTAQIGGCTITSTVQKLPSSVQVSLVASNPSSKPVSLTYTVTVMKIDYSGDPASRVFVPSDYTTTNILTQQVTQNVNAASSQTQNLRVDNVSLVPQDQSGPIINPNRPNSSRFLVTVSETPKLKLPVANFQGSVDSFGQKS